MTPLQDMLQTAGPQAERIAGLWWMVLGLCAVVLVAILAALAFALWRAPRATADTPADVDVMGRPEPGARYAVIAAVAVSIAGLLAIVVMTGVTDRALAQLPLHNALTVEVVAHRWWWHVRYEDHDPAGVFTTANEIVVPVGRPVLLKLRSSDVIHSFWVPNLAGKKDLIPGHTAQLQLRADREGSYRGQCAEFCGHQHANMAFQVTAVPPEAFERWADAQRQPAPPPSTPQQRRGQELFLTGTCMMCHAIQGTPANGRKAPDLTHVASRETIAAGALRNTPANLASWIRDPQRHKPGVNMPAHRIADDDLQALVAYLGTLR